MAGGASASVHSLKAAQFGFFGAAPLVAVRLYLWSDQGRASHPALDSYCSGRAEEVSPLLLNMAAWQAGASPQTLKPPPTPRAAPAAFALPAVMAVLVYACFSLCRQHTPCIRSWRICSIATL